MNKVDKNKPVTSIRHDDKRAAIPDSAHHLCVSAAMPPFRASWLYLVPPFTMLNTNERANYQIFPPYSDISSRKTANLQRLPSYFCQILR